MRAKWILAMCMSMVFCLTGCDNFLPGLIAGAAGQETVESWKENLEAKKAELQVQYDQQLAVYQAATDPNTAALEKQKLETISNAQLANASALLVVENLLSLPEYQGKSPGERSDMILTALLSAGVITIQELRKRKQGKKYLSMKIGKAAFEKEEPVAAVKLHAAIGEARISKGL